VVSYGNSFAISNGRDADGAFCAIKGLTLWAKGKALTNAQTDIANFNRATFLGAVSSAYIQVKQSPLLKSTDKAIIEAWLTELARQSRVFYQAKRDALTVQPNNIQYWGGFGIAMAGVALNNSDYFDWGVTALPLGACTATDQGALPREVAREERALHYHLFALQPLVGLAELAERNGRPGYSVCNGVLHKIIEFTLSSVDNPAIMAGLAGKAQLPLGILKSDNDLAWLEIYASRFPDFMWAPRLPSLRAFANSNLGGKLSAIYAVK
jgi:poly(beta-D-mannuronate) lyase